MNLALFDFDGTVTSSDTWTPFMRFAIRPARMLAGRALLIPVAVGYRLGMVSASRGRQMAARVGFQGEEAAAVRQLGVEYATTVLPGTLRQSALERIEWHKSEGDDVVLVSASLDVYLGPWCEGRGVDYICTTLEERDGRLTGRYVQGDCSGAEKVRRILHRYELSRYAVVYAYGDSHEDREMLDLAHKKYYRWREISSWDDVASSGHPSASRPDRGHASNAGRR
jgi:HAD superfamily hydrolase (TIGR01490 family)